MVVIPTASSQPDEHSFAPAEPQIQSRVGTTLRDVAARLCDPSRLVIARPVELDEDTVLAAWAHALRRRDAGEGPETLQLYMHFGYCPMHCRFCQYWHVVPKSDEQLEAFVDSQVAVIERHHARLGRVRASNAYFGGGTPTVIPARGLDRVMAAFRRFADVEHEFTCEGHPSTLDDAKIDVLLSGGVNRVSMGIQSLDRAVLDRVGRTMPPMSHTGRLIARLQAERVSVSIDLIAGLPEQTPESLLSDVLALLPYGADMITIYRYAPVRGLPENTVSSVYTPAVYRTIVPKAIRHGYAALKLPGAMMLLRPTKRLAREGLLTRIDDRVHRRYVLRRFNHHHSHDTNMIGLGAGADSHCFGFGWFRDVTTVRRGDAPRVYLGSRFDDQACARAIALTTIADTGSLDVRRLARVVRSPRLVEHVVRCAELASGTSRLGTIRWPRAMRRSTDPEALHALALVEPATDEEARSIVSNLDRLRTRDGVTRDLMIVEQGLIRESTAPRGEDSAADASVLAEWIARAGAKVGEPLGANLVVQHIDRRSIHVRSVSDDATLRILIRKRSAVPSYFADDTFSIAYASEAARSLDAGEQRILDEVCAITRAFAKTAPPPLEGSGAAARAICERKSSAA